MKKIFIKIIISYSSNCEINKDNNTIVSKCCEVKSQELLQNKLNDGLPILFALTQNDTCLFIIKNECAIEFVFDKFTYARWVGFISKLKLRN